MQPFQLWLPTVGYSLTATAANQQRAFAAWGGESRVWLLLWAESPSTMRWQDKPGWWCRQLAVPADHMDCIDIFHVRENGEVRGPGAEKRFPDGCVKGLLDAWLNLEWGSTEDESGETPSPFCLHRPLFDGGYVTYREKIFYREVTSDADLAEYLDAGPTFWEDRLPDKSSNSPGTTRHKHQRAKYEGPQSVRPILPCPQWLAPLAPRQYFEDIVVAHGQMAEIERNREKDPLSALRKAQEAAMPYITEGFMTRELKWLWFSGPTIWKIATGDDATDSKLLFEDAQRRYGIRARDIEEAKRSGEWQRTMSPLSSIRRAWGIVGLFWALFLEKLEHDQPQECSRCGRMIEGRRGKKFCGRADNRACYRRRRADDKRKSRAGSSYEQQDI